MREIEIVRDKERVQGCSQSGNKVCMLRDYGEE